MLLSGPEPVPNALRIGWFVQPGQVCVDQCPRSLTSGSSQGPSTGYVRMELRADRARSDLAGRLNGVGMLKDLAGRIGGGFQDAFKRPPASCPHRFDDAGKHDGVALNEGCARPPDAAQALSHHG